MALIFDIINQYNMAEKSTIFEFVSYRFEPAKKSIFFDYKVSQKGISPIFFTETIVLPKPPNLNGVQPELLAKVLQGVHLALGISYYKLHCAGKIKTNYSICKEESDFWNTFYKKGLGELFYRNKLNPNIFPGFPFDKKAKQENYRLERNNKFLVGVAGGKDSIVASELLKKYGADFSAIFFETQKASLLVDNIINKMKVESFKVRRLLDDKIFDKEAYYYSGHVPVSGMYAFLGILSGVFYHYSSFVVANEFSSNFGNTRYKGAIINHQWSKSSEFENLFQNYVKNFISPDLFYFSILRPFYEIRIAELFTNYKEYFYEFSSCNSNFKINSQEDETSENRLWCGQCSKCAFVFLILSPFLSKEVLISIFGSDLLEDPRLLVTFRDILGFGRAKPFDCVGTYEESRAALYMAKDKFRDDLAGEIFLPKIDPDDNRYFFNEKKLPLKIYFQGQRKPQELIEKVFKTQPSSVPDYLKFLGMRNALILGYGREGKAVEEYLKNNFYGIKIGIGEAKNNSEYLSMQKSYDIAVRSPGIPKEFLKIPYTTATNIFFSYVKQLPDVKIIGVTGTKGKSTTASLIHHILKEAGKNTQLSGNIGIPMINALSEKIKRGTIFVLELSSYQLDDIKYSPDIAVVTSLFPEHMNYHNGLKNYYKAKKNIIMHQEKEDIFVFNPENKKVAGWKSVAKGKTVPFAGADFLDGVKSQLIGSHNKDNTRAAAAVAKELGIPDLTIKRAIETFKPLAHRLEFVGDFKNIRFYDDAISTTPESTILAIESLKDVDTIFLGGEDRGYNFSRLEKIIKKYKIKNIVLFPESGNKIKIGGEGLNILKTKSMEEAVKFAYGHTEPGKICLLSCASPSYSIWRDFEEKGDQFKFYVKDLAKL